MAGGSDASRRTISSRFPLGATSRVDADVDTPRVGGKHRTPARTVRVLLPLPLADAYDYSVPEGLDVAPGPFRRRAAGQARDPGRGVGRGHAAKSPQPSCAMSIDVLPALPMADALRRFVDWVAAYTLSPPGAVLRMAMSSPSALEAPTTELVYRPAVDAADDTLKLTAARRRVLEALKDGPAMAGCRAGAYRRRRHVGDQDHGVGRVARSDRAADAALVPAARRRARGPDACRPSRRRRPTGWSPR